MTVDHILGNGGSEKISFGASALLISADPRDGLHIAAALDSGGFAVENVDLRGDVVDTVIRIQPQVILLESPLLDDYTLSFCERLREAFSTPMILCSSSRREWDIVRGLESGADDYFVMPMRSVEFAARLRAVLRRASELDKHAPNGERIVAGRLEVRLDEHRAYRNGRPLDLSPIEFRLLASLVRETGRAVSYAKLLLQAWGPEYVDCRNYLRLYVRHLRSKLEDDPSHPQLIVNHWGVGYRLEPAAA